MTSLPPRWYFAYGSNMDSESLRRRDIVVHESERAWLRGYRLVFDLGVELLTQEPRMANLREAPGETVHGVAHRIDAADLERLDAMEFTYDRVDVELTLYGGEPAAGSVYICTNPAFLLPEAPPSERYMQILRHGAREHDLDPAFCAWLDAHPALVMPPDPGLPPELAALPDTPTFTHADLAAPGPSGRPHLGGFGGFVFDFAGFDNALLDAFFVGQDATSFLIGRRLDVPPPTSPEALRPVHVTWLHHALHDLVRVARIAGRLEGGLAASLEAGRTWAAVRPEPSDGNAAADRRSEPE